MGVSCERDESYKRWEVLTVVLLGANAEPPHFAGQTRESFAQPRPYARLSEMAKTRKRQGKHINHSPGAASHSKARRLAAAIIALSSCGKWDTTENESFGVVLENQCADSVVAALGDSRDLAAQRIRLFPETIRPGSVAELEYFDDGSTPRTIVLLVLVGSSSIESVIESNELAGGPHFVLGSDCATVLNVSG